MNRSFVESYYTNELEKCYGKFNTSLWVKPVPTSLTKTEKQKLYIEKYKNLKSKNITMLSASFETFEFLSEYFPNKKCNYWMSGEVTKERLNLLKKMANSPTVNVILVDGNKNLLK